MRSSTESSRFFNSNELSPKSAFARGIARISAFATTAALTATAAIALAAVPALSLGSGSAYAADATPEPIATIQTDQLAVAPPLVTSKVSPVIAVLNKLAVKGRAPKTGYDRSLFGDGWGNIGSCDTRNFILQRDLTNITWRSGETCMVATGILRDPYTGKVINFVRGVSTSLKVQIDHVVAVSDAWQKGAQQWSGNKRVAFYNDPLNLLAVDGPTNGAKSDSDAASWLPPNKAYRCAYVARQVAVKSKYGLWVTAAEKTAIASVLSNCPAQQLPR